MEIVLREIHSTKNSTARSLVIDGVFFCFTIENGKRLKKILKETRLESGIYNLGLRAEGGHHERYLKRFPKIHEGMLCLYNRPDWIIVSKNMVFQYILFHIGNDKFDTDGCILPNTNIRQNTGEMSGSFSEAAYIKIYLHILQALKRKEKVTVEIIDL